MAKGPVFSTITAAFASASKLNANFDAITTAFENTISRDGFTPNAMNANLDMDSNNIVNVASLDADTIILGGTIITASVSIPAAAETHDFDTRAIVAAANVSTDFNFIRTSGFSVVGDGGGAFYKAVGAEPSHAFKVQSNDGQWWEGLTASDGSVTADQFGAVGNGSTNDSAAIQSAVDDFPVVRFLAKTYGISAPIQFGSQVSLIGVSSGENDTNGETQLLKLDTTTGTGSNTSPPSDAVVDSYVQNAVLILTHPDTAFNYHCRIKDIEIRGTANHTTNYGIYAPRTSQLYLENVFIAKCETSFKTFTSWLTTFVKVQANSDTIDTLLAGEKSISTRGWATTTRGFWWAKDGTGDSTGTSLTMISCWARQCHKGYDISNLAYSTLNSCAADDINTTAYAFELCNITMNGCGMEAVICNPGLLFSNGFYVLNTFQANAGIYGANGNAVYRAIGSAEVTFISCRMDDYATVNSALNRIIDTGTQVVEINTKVPTNGNVFLSLSNGATLSALKDGVQQFRDSVTTRNAKQISDQNGGQLFKKDKTILSAGSAILTITAGGAGGKDFAVGKIKMFYVDEVSTAGVGYIEVAFCVYREATNHFQSIDQGGLDVIAGNSFNTAPTFTIAEGGGVWTITVTPAHGDMLGELIEVEWNEKASGDVTVVFV